MNATSSHRMADVAIGSVNAFTCGAIIIHYLPIIKVVATDPDLKDKSCYKLIFHLAISDLICAFFHGSFGILTLTGYAAKISFELNKVCGAILDGLSWYSGTFLLHLLALNRWAVITDNQLSDVLFSTNGCRMLTAVVWMYSIAWMTVLLSPYGLFLYVPSEWSFSFDTSAPWSKSLKTANWVHNQLVLWPSAVYYTLTIIHIRKQKRSENVEQAKQKQIDTNRGSGSERSLVTQAVVIFLYCMLGSQYWHAAGWLRKEFRYAFALGNWLWLSNAGINPLVYLTLNKTLSRKVHQNLCFNSSVAPHTTRANQRTTKYRPTQNRNRNKAANHRNDMVF